MENKYRVLVVDDLPTNLQLIGITLNKLGIKAIVAQNGQQALKIALQNPPDLILLDIMMPGIDGYEVCTKLKENPRTKEIPVIFLTAKTQIEDIVKGFDVGGVDYVTKPFNAQELESRVLTHLDLKRSRDIIQEKNIQLEKLNATKDKMYSIIAHDLRGPIGNFQVLLDLMIDNSAKISAQTHEKYLNMLRDVSKNAFYLLDNLLNWARSQRNEVTIKKEKTDISLIIDDSVNLLKMSAMTKNIEISVEMNEVQTVFVDRLMIQTVVRNLLNNAIKFTPDGGEIRIKALKNEQFIEISVEDNGIGIPESTRSKLFDPSEHITTYGTNNEKGSGLGLNLCYDFVSKNNGTICVESEEGKGSKFIVSLPDLQTEIR